MKKFRTLSAIAAAAMAVSMIPVSASAEDTTYHAYIGVQSASYSFRNAWYEPTYGQGVTGDDGMVYFDQIPAEVHCVEECLVILGRCSNVVTEAVNNIACTDRIVQVFIVLESVGHMSLNVRTVIGKDIVLVPVKEHTGGSGSLILVAC